MKTIASLFLGLVLAAGAAADEAALDLSKPPTFGEMTKAGMKFETPGWVVKERMPKVHRHGTPQGAPPQPAPRRATEIMEAEPVSLAVAKGEGKSGSIDWTSVDCEFPAAELVEPGKYYPPKLPIVDETKISRIHLTAESENPAELIKQAAEALKVLGVTDAKFDAWNSMEMWKNSPRFNASYDGQIPRVELGLHVNEDERTKKTTAIFYLIVGDWEAVK